MHRKAGRKLGMKTAHRKAVMANMCSSLIKHERVETTLTRAKELRRMAERMITLGKRNTIHARRQAMQVLRDNRAVKHVFDQLAPRFADRMGGYTRILKLGYRRGDSAPMAIIEYLGFELKAPSETEKKGAKPAKKKAAPKKKAAEKKPAAKKAEKKSEKKAAPKKAAKKTEKKSSAKKTTKKSSKASTSK